MSTGIQWTDETWNPVVGCDRVSPGCAHCYAKALHDMRHAAKLAGKSVAAQYAVPFESVQLMPDRLVYPLGWRKPRRIFVNSVSDLFHADVPERYIDRVFAVMSQTQRHTYQVLTKRPARMLAYTSAIAALSPKQRTVRFVTSMYRGHPAESLVLGGGGLREENAGGLPWPLPNVWLGGSVENQRWADERIPLLLQTPAAARFLSCEPLLGPVDLTAIAERVGEHSTVTYSALDEHGRDQWRGSRVDWVIIGGESGAGARPFNLQWVRDIVRQCQAAGVAPFVKQLGAMPYGPDDRITARGYDGSLGPMPQGFSRCLSDRHGADTAEWPEDLRVREFPGGAS